MAGSAIDLKVTLHRSALDARRGVVRVHPVVLRALGLKNWDPLELCGRRTTGALAAPSHAREGSVLMDDLTCANARAAEGERVTVARADVRPARAIHLTGLPADSAPAPEQLRLALLGKIAASGDQLGMLPQDFTRPEAGDELDRLVASLEATYGREWQNLAVTVGTTVPEGLVRITMETEVSIGGHGATAGSSAPIGGRRPTADSLPGLESQCERLRELLDLAFNRPEVMLKFGAQAHLGVLVYGPPGSGKGALVEAVAGQVGARLVRKWGPSLARADPSSAAAELTMLFADAATNAPAIVMIEDVDAPAPRDDAGPLLSVLLELIASAIHGGRIGIVCTTAHPESVSPELRRPGVLDHEIEIPLPHRSERRRMLEVLSRGLPLAPDVSLDDVAAATPGYVAADLMALCREAALRAAQRTAKSGAPFVSKHDFVAAVEVIKPSSLDGLSVEVADVSMADVGDMDENKKELTEAVVWPLAYPDTFARLGVEPVKGVLLYGPPGCGKTFLVKALVNEVQANFLSVKGAELLSKWVGESERAVRELFGRARGAAPALIFLDEIDALAPARGTGSDSNVTDRVVAALLTELDGIEDLENVVVVGATNRPDLVDPALLRPGRLERLVYVPPPDGGARGKILAAATRRMPLEPGLDVTSIAAECEGFSAADLEGLARSAAMTAMRQSIDAPIVTLEHFEIARSEATPSLNRDVVQRLEAFASERTG